MTEERERGRNEQKKRRKVSRDNAVRVNDGKGKGKAMVWTQEPDWNGQAREMKNSTVGDKISPTITLLHRMGLYT